MKKVLSNIIIRNSSFPIGKGIARAIITFASNIIRTRIFNHDATRGPLFITWLSTYNCNAKCRFCATHKLKEEYPATMSLEFALKTAHDIGKSGVWTVGFTGGEVLLWPHLFKVIKVLKQYNLSVYIVTNGLLLKDNVDEIINAKVDSVVISIDSLIPKEHDNGRGRKGVLQALIEGITELKRRRSKNGKPIIKSTTILSNQNYHNIVNIIEELSDIVDVPSIQPITTGYEYHPHQIAEENRSTYLIDDDEEGVRRHLQRLVNRFPDFNNNYFKNIPYFFFNPKKLLDVRCWSPFLRLQIFPNGRVVHCSVNPKYSFVGDLTKESLMQVWNSIEMKRQREEIRCHRNNCICWCQDSSFNAFLDNIPFSRHIPIFNKTAK